MSSDPKLIPYVLPLIEGYKILDIACGKGKWGYLLRVDFWYTSSGKSSKKQVEYLIGTDVFQPYLNFVKKHEVYDDVILCDALHLPFKDQSFDTSLAIEVIEHLKKKDGDKLLNEAERVSGKSVIITTPHNPFRQDSLNGNVHQTHISKWSAKEFEVRGYNIFCKPIISSFSSLVLAFLISKFIYIVPRLMSIFPHMPFCLIAKKTKGL